MNLSLFHRRWRANRGSWEFNRKGKEAMLAIDRGLITKGVEREEKRRTAADLRQYLKRPTILVPSIGGGVKKARTSL